MKFSLVHPNYIASNKGFDYALLLLDKPTSMHPLLRLPSGGCLFRRVRPAPASLVLWQVPLRCNAAC